MDSRQPDVPVGGVDDEMGDEEIEVTREELIAALQEVVTDLSDGLKGSDRESYLSADDLAQNDWFFAGVSDEQGQFAVTMWPAEGDEDMLRIDIGTEEEVHTLASDPDQVAAMTDDFIEGMAEYDEEFYEEEEEEEEEELEEEEEFDEEEEYIEEEELDEELEEDDIDETEDQIGRDGSTRP
jgi:hypothetical protein